MPASFFSWSSIEGEAAFTFTVKPLASRCFTQLPQHSQVADFQTSITGASVSELAARSGAWQKMVTASAARTSRSLIQCFSRCEVAKKLELGLDPGPPTEGREHSGQCLHMTYSGCRQHQQPTSDDKPSADCARQEVPSEHFFREYEGRNKRH